MSVLIEGMEMPTACFACKMLYEPYWKCRVHGDANHSTDRRPTNCPLIEVPEPHGRLIDADEMFDEFVAEGQRSKRYKLGEKWELNGEEIRSVISRLPTVIPASGTEVE